MGRFPVKKYGPLQVIDHKTMYAETEKWLKEVKMDFDPKALLGSLSVGQMQSVEIAKAVSQQARVVIFDEPTSSNFKVMPSNSRRADIFSFRQ